MFCPVCETKGCKTKLILKQINFSTAVYMCQDIKCTYPVGYEWIMVTRTLEDMNKPQEEFEEQLKSQQSTATVNASAVDVIDFDQWLSDAFSSNVVRDNICNSNLSQIDDVFDMLEFDSLLSGAPLNENKQNEAVTHTEILNLDETNVVSVPAEEKTSDETILNSFELTHNLPSENIKLKAASSQAKELNEILVLNRSPEETDNKNKISLEKKSINNKIKILNNIVLDKNIKNKVVVPNCMVSNSNKITLQQVSDINKICPLKTNTDNRIELDTTSAIVRNSKELSKISVANPIAKEAHSKDKESPPKCDTSKKVNLLNGTTFSPNFLRGTQIRGIIKNAVPSNTKESNEIPIEHAEDTSARSNKNPIKNDTNSKVKTLKSIVLSAPKTCKLDVNPIDVPVENKKPKKDMMNQVLKLVEASQHFKTILSKKL